MQYGTLYLVGTPIGNLNDISNRTLEILETVDFIAAEDTRNTLKILNHFNIKKSMTSYYEHNKVQKGSEIISRLKNGENCALVTDAGMPAISDPGEDIVRQCHENDIKVSVVPGPCAFVCALALSGFPSKRFTFEGFLETNKKERNAHLESLSFEKRTMIFYEAPHKLLSTLIDMEKVFSDRNVAIIKEITKIYEDVKITTLKSAIQFFQENTPKGEFVIVLKGSEDEEKNPLNELSIEKHIDFYKDKGFSNTEALKAVAKDRGLRKNEVYKLQLENNNK